MEDQTLWDNKLKKKEEIQSSHAMPIERDKKKERENYDDQEND